MAKRGDLLILTCLGCKKEFRYTYQGGRIRKFHDPEHKDAKGKLTHCRWHWSNTGRRALKAEQLKAQEGARIQALVKERAELFIRLRAGRPLNKTQLRELPREILETRHALGLMLGRDSVKETVEDRLEDFHDLTGRILLPLLEAIEERLRD